MENLETQDMNEPMEDSSPVYYNTNHLSLIAILSGIFSWIVLAGYLLTVTLSVLFLKTQLVGANLGQIIQDPQAQLWMTTNIVSPLMTGIAFFFVLQGVALGLNVLMELDLNTKE